MTFEQKKDSLDLSVVNDSKKEGEIKALLSRIDKAHAQNAETADTALDGLIAKLVEKYPGIVKGKTITKAEINKSVAKLKRLKNIVPKKVDKDKIVAQIKKQYPRYTDKQAEDLAKLRIQAQVDRAEGITKMINTLVNSSFYTASELSNAGIDPVSYRPTSPQKRSRDLPKDAQIGAITERQEVKKFKRKSPTYGKVGGAKLPYYYEYRMNRRDVDDKILLKDGGSMYEDGGMIKELKEEIAFVKKDNISNWGSQKEKDDYIKELYAEINKIKGKTELNVSKGDIIKTIDGRIFYVENPDYSEHYMWVKTNKNEKFGYSLPKIDVEDVVKSSMYEDGGKIGQEIVFDDQGEENTGVIKGIHEITGDYIVDTNDGRTVLAQRDRDVISLGAMRKKPATMDKPKRFGFFNKGGKMKDGGNLTHKFEKIAWDKMNSNERFHTLDYQFPRGYSIDEKRRLSLNEYDNLPMEIKEKIILPNKLKDGGSVDANKEMLKNQSREVSHHADELDKVLKHKLEVEPWVIAKMERATTDLSDVTHYLDGEQAKAYSKPIYKQGGAVEITSHRKNIMGTLSFGLKMPGMRKPQEFIVYPVSSESDVIRIQSDTRFGIIGMKNGNGLMSQPHASGAYGHHMSIDKLTPFSLSDAQLEELKEKLSMTAGKSVGSSIVKTDNSGADKFSKGGGVKPVTYYVAYTSYFDTNKYDEDKITKALTSIGATDIHLENEDGQSNQPEVVVFKYAGDGTDYDPTKAVQKAFDTDWIIVRVKDWRTKKMVKGGGISSQADYVSKRDISKVEYKKDGSKRTVTGKDLYDGIYINKNVKFTPKTKRITLAQLMNAEGDVWDEQNWQSGDDIRKNTQTISKFANLLSSKIKALGVQKGSLSNTVFDKLEDENYHLLNEFLAVNGYFKNDYDKYYPESSYKQYKKYKKTDMIVK